MTEKTHSEKFNSLKSPEPRWIPGFVALKKFSIMTYFWLKEGDEETLLSEIQSAISQVSSQLLVWYLDSCARNL